MWAQWPLMSTTTASITTGENICKNHNQTYIFPAGNFANKRKYKKSCLLYHPFIVCNMEFLIWCLLVLQCLHVYRLHLYIYFINMFIISHLFYIILYLLLYIIWCIIFYNIIHYIIYILYHFILYFIYILYIVFQYKFLHI